jgi:glutathione S-transferase
MLHCMTIYELAHSPFCIPIRRMLEAAQVRFWTVEVPNHDRSEVLRLTNGAYYQVPVLEHDGRLIYESGSDTQDVARYVDATYCGGRLFPARCEGWQAILLPYLENEVEGVTFRLCDIHYIPTITDVAARGMLIRHKERKFGRGCIEAWRANREGLWSDAVAKLTPFDQMTAQTRFLTGETPIYADFLLFGILGNLTYKNWNPFPPLANLEAWNKRLLGFAF